MKEIYSMDYDGRNQVKKLPFKEWLDNLQPCVIIGTPEMCIKRIREFMDLGVTNFIFRSVRQIPNFQRDGKTLRY